MEELFIEPENVAKPYEEELEGYYEYFSANDPLLSICISDSFTTHL